MIALATPLFADIYVYADREGVLHFTNVPTSSQSSNYKIYIKETPNKPLESYNEDLYDHVISEASNTHGIVITSYSIHYTKLYDLNLTS